MAYAYFSGGAEAERLLHENVTAWWRWRLLPHVLRDVSSVSTATTLLGSPVATPVVVGPTALHRLAHPDAEVATVGAASEAGAAMVVSTMSTCDLEEIAAAAPGAVLFMQVYVLKDRARTADMVRRAAAAGFRALVFTVDVAVSGRRTREVGTGIRVPSGPSLPNVGQRPGPEGPEWDLVEHVVREFDPALSLDDIGWLAELSSLPVVVKGICRADDALACAQAGAAGVVVSNHGGRQLDDAPPTAEVLGEIADALGGRIEVWVDGGVRRGADVAKALALGARGVLLGRPVLWALAAAGRAGVFDLLAGLRSELERVMALCGAVEPGQLDRSLVRRFDGHPGERR
jgi:4-hydroxymandelate oxidase